MRCRIILADDHRLFRQGLRSLLEKAGHEVVGEAPDGRAALALAQTLQPDIAVLDLSMPLLNGLDAAAEIKRIAPNTKTILLTMYTDREYVLRALHAGARGYVLKTQAADDLVRAIREIYTGEVYLSPAVAVSVVDAYLGRANASEDPLTPRERQICSWSPRARPPRRSPACSASASRPPSHTAIARCRSSTSTTSPA